MQVAACGMSGSEINRFRWTDAYHAGRPKDMTRLLPRVMGHELSGVVFARGSYVTNVSEGMPVVVQPVIGCRTCEFCDLGYINHCDHRITIGVHADGGFAEYVAIPAANLYPVPSGVSLKEIALLQPFAIANYALEIGQIQAGHRIGVWGVGAIGVSIVQQALMAGASVEFAVGRDPSRLQAVKELGVRHTIWPAEGDPAQRLLDEFSDNKLDVIFEASGHTPAINSALDLLKKRGSVVLIGNLKDPFEGDLLGAIMKQQNILTVRTYSLGAWRRALNLFVKARHGRDAIPIEYTDLTNGISAFERAVTNPGTKFVFVPSSTCAGTENSGERGIKRTG